jgi:hypothetical protein
MITSRRCEILKKALSSVKVIEIGKIKLNTSDLEFTELPKSSYTKIGCTRIREISNELIIQEKKMAKLIKTKFLAELYPNKKIDELELLSAMSTDKELKTLARDHGMEDAEITKKLK